MGVGLTYANEEGEFSMWCTVHEDFEMFHTCAGGEGEPLGYCGSWPGDYKEETQDETPFHRYRDPTCELVPLQLFGEDEDDLQA